MAKINRYLNIIKINSIWFSLSLLYIKTNIMKEYKIIKQPGTTVRKDKDFEDLLNSYGQMKWRVVNVFKHRGFLKAVIERDLENKE